jgi:hypothetical protein
LQFPVTLKIHGSNLSLMPALAIELEIEFQNVHTRFTKKSQVATLGVFLHQCA